jgi:hypothetical protein
MVLLDIGDTLGAIQSIIIFAVPIILLIIGFLVRKGIISKENAETAETIIRVLGNSIETFKTEDKPASKKLTELVEAKATGEKVKEPLKKYLDKFNLNK